MGKTIMSVGAERLPRVYMAGKIAKGDWRHTLVGPSLRNASLTLDRTTETIRPIDPVTVGGFEYAGPFFLGDDHGCFHGPHSHGFGLLHWPSGEGSGLVDDRLMDALHPDRPDWWFHERRNLISRSCLQQVTSADVVFAWIDQYDAYGTLVELGYAAAKGIPTYVNFNLMYDRPGHGPDSPTSVWNDWWFAEQVAASADMDVDAEAAWRSFVTWWKQRDWVPSRTPRRKLWFVEW